MRRIDADALIENLKSNFDNGDVYTDKDQFIIDCIHLLDNAPTVEPETKLVANVTFDKEQMEKLVEKAKADILAQIERPQGEWIECTERFTLDTYYECSNCKEPWITIEGTPWQNMMNFCPNCGADMRGKGV